MAHADAGAASFPDYLTVPADRLGEGSGVGVGVVEDMDAIAAAMADESAQGHIATLLDHIVIDGDDDATRAAHNAVHQASEIARRSSPIAAAVSRGELCVAAGVFVPGE